MPFYVTPAKTGASEHVPVIARLPSVQCSRAQFITLFRDMASAGAEVPFQGWWKSDAGSRLVWNWHVSGSARCPRHDEVSPTERVRAQLDELFSSGRELGHILEAGSIHVFNDYA